MIGIHYTPLKARFHKVLTESRPLLEASKICVNESLKGIVFDLEQKTDLLAGAYHEELIVLLRPVDEQYAKRR